MAKSNIKIFVLDTNVLLHDYKCIYNFQDNDIVIPIVALEELDKFKKGNDTLNFNARECTRELDELIGKADPVKGIPIGKGHGKLYLALGQKYPDSMKVSFPEPTADHRILAIAEKVSKDNPGRKVVVVSKDINLRVKAKSLGIAAEDYTTDKVQNIEVIYKGIDTIDNVDPELINKIYQDRAGVSVDEFKFSREIFAHEYLILKGDNKSALTHYDPFERRINLVEKRKIYGIEPRNAEQALALDALMRPEINLISLTGKAGTGKTLLAVAAALQQAGTYEQIFVARPIIPLTNQDLGFLPGDVKEKIGPYMMPLFDNLGVIKHQFGANSKEVHKIDEMLKDERLVITPLAYIRGRSLSNAFFIIDEAQNLTPHEVKTIVTRAGENVKIVFTGDIQQIDSPYLDSTSNGLSYLTDKMKGQNLFAHMNLVKGERSALAELASDLL
ncbi:MAG: PhoH family protein [Salinivirgaceae bacterium]|nr:PhoH family protein [Salinivirgaceae bacterium]MBR2194368.1 PhoH family protein [Salinivirgaceae bacterium]